MGGLAARHVVRQLRKQQIVRPFSKATRQAALAHEREASADPRAAINPVGIQHISEQMHAQVFGSRRHTAPDIERIEAAKVHLANNDLLGKKTTVVDPVVFPLPQLLGKDLDEHFANIGQALAEPYLPLAQSLVNTELPPVPQPHDWLVQSGWTKYTAGQQPLKVDYPDEDQLVFDTEVLYKISQFPVIAVAASPTAWYSWISPWLLKETENPRHLVPLGPRDRHRVVVGHNVGYDRKRVKEEYHVNESNSFYLDTMSLHIAVNGMCSRQRPAWLKMNKLKKNEDAEAEVDAEAPIPDTSTADRSSDLESEMLSQDLEENPWFTYSALNNLADVAALHCGITVDKSPRDYFGELDRDGVVSMFGDLVSYCANDVFVTHKVYQKVLPSFLALCPHPVSFAALRNLSALFLPISKKWDSFIENAESSYQAVQEEIYELLKRLAGDALEAKNNPKKHAKDPWLSQLDWTIKPVRMVKSKKQGEPDRLAKNQKFPGEPQWYRDLYPAAAKPMNLTLRTRIAPLLLRLQWDGHPLIWCNEHGWLFKVKRSIGYDYEARNYTMIDKSKIDQFKSDRSHLYFKIPHNGGQEARCTNPMAKQYISFFERGILTSEYKDAKSAVELHSQCSYWVSSRDRIAGQMPVYSGDVDMGISPNGPDDFGMILPKLIPMGTVTRRAVEDLWLTASNAKKSRIGSELKSLVEAPPGYKFVGADVDSEELWIASLIGDSLFGIHGGTALGWMTLEGSKNEGTDLHSKTAAILGISRNDAKVFNYGRMYGAGLKFAIRLLKQFNPLISDEDATTAAAKLYESTKGKKARAGVFASHPFWRGGSESIVFNRLEEMAEQDEPRTPVLGAAVTKALNKQNLRKSNFLTSRINWTIQSSGVDYLHLLIASMQYLTKEYNISARLVVTVHDEIRYLVKEEDQYRAALALQVSNLWTRSMFCQQLGINNVPQSVAFFSLIDIDTVLRKEVDLDCVTPSQPNPIPPGEAIDIQTLLAKCSTLSADGEGHAASGHDAPDLYTYEIREPVVESLATQANALEYLQAQIAFDDSTYQGIVKSAKKKNAKPKETKPRVPKAKTTKPKDPSKPRKSAKAKKILEEESSEATESPSPFDFSAGSRYHEDVLKLEASRPMAGSYPVRSEYRHY